MELLQFLQLQTGISRRKIILFLSKWFIKVNWVVVYDRKSFVDFWDEITISLPWYKTKKFIVKRDQKERIEMIVLNKPKWFVVSKEDPHNRTIFELLPWDFKQKWYYIWRLDKNSRWLVLLTNFPSIVNEFEHPSKKIEKKYIVQIDKPFKVQDIYNCKKWFLIDEQGRKFNWLTNWQKKHVEQTDFLKFDKIKYFQYWWKHFLDIILTEGKKRHIRRLLKSLWYKVLDLKRIKVWPYNLWNLKEWKRRKVAFKK
jgi:23S rRNA pseudouridine2605 synthase